MNFKRKILLEAVVRYIITFGVVGLLYNTIKIGLQEAATGDKLEAVAVVMGIISLCSLTGYFSFSYTVVAKNFWSRMFGYICAFGVTLPLILSFLILYFIASIWIPEMSIIWFLILFVLYFAVFIFDLIDLMRMGLDIAATSFFETSNTETASDSLNTLLKEINKGQRLSYANCLIGSALIELAEQLKDQDLALHGQWILDNADRKQYVIDQKVIQAFEKYKEDKQIKNILINLEQKQNQTVADSLINQLIQYLKKQERLLMHN